MNRPIAKLGAMTLLALGIVISLPGGSRISTGTSFSCYCNGGYMGEYTSIQRCYDDCGK